MTGAPQQINSQQLLTVAEVAERLAVSTRTVRRLIDSGELVTHRVGRAVRISEADLAAYAREARQ